MSHIDHANSIPGDAYLVTHVHPALPEAHQDAIRRLEAAERIARRLGDHDKADRIHARMQGVADRQH